MLTDYAAGIETLADLGLRDIVTPEPYARLHARDMQLHVAQAAIPHAYAQSAGVCCRQQSSDSDEISV
jgi:hypothetical protein